MRCSFALAAALVLAATPAASQAQVGAKSGLSFGNVSNSGLLPGEVGVRTGFTVGVSAFIPGPLGLGVEGLYSQRGVSGQAGARSHELGYLDLPLLVRVKVPAPIAPFAYAGPQISYELACNSGSGDCPRGDRPRAPRAAIIGGGVAFGGDTQVSLEARYIYGLQDLELETITAEENYRERSFMVLAGISF